MRDALCSVSFVSLSTGHSENYCEPAVVRTAKDHLAPDAAATSYWGRRALAWQYRLAAGQVRELFPSGWPVDTALARWYLKMFQQTYLTQRGACKVHLVEQEEKRWARELWQETLEDSAFSLQGFLEPWQHDILLVKGGKPESALSPYVHFRLEASQASWQLITRGTVAASGHDPGLSAARLQNQLTDYLRRRALVEVGPTAVHGLLLASCMPSSRRTETSSMRVAGRHLNSGLPTRQNFAWPEFLASRPGVLEAWHRVKRRIFEQAKEVAGGISGGGEGLDLPGWRVLTSGALAPLFVQGAVVAMMDETG